jgi:S1-C subfamily serine protease
MAGAYRAADVLHARRARGRIGVVRSTVIALLLVVAAAAVVPSLGSAQSSTIARRERVARAVARSTVTITTSVGEGAGFVVGDERWIVTNFDVVESAEPGSIYVQFANGATRSAHVLSSRSDCDLALLAIDGGAVPASPLALADSDDVTVGQLVYAFGSPFGFASSVSGGHVTARQDIMRSARPLGRELIETDTRLATGSAGAPLVDARGRVIGVNWLRLRDGTTQYVGIPSNHVREMLARVRRARLAAPSTAGPAPDALAWIGIVVADSVPGTRMGVRVLHVVPGSMAARAGIRGALDPSTGAGEGQTIAVIDGQTIGDRAELEACLSSRAPGQVVRIWLQSGVGATARTSQTVMLLPAVR